MKHWLTNCAVTYAAAWVLANCLYYLTHRTFVWSMVPAYFFLIILPIFYPLAKIYYRFHDQREKRRSGVLMAICAGSVSVAVAITVASLVYLCVMYGVSAVVQGDAYFVDQPLSGGKPWILSVRGVLVEVKTEASMVSIWHFVGLSIVWPPLMALLYYQVCRRLMPELPGLAEMGEKKQESTDDSSS